jgi:hypothetical protein
MLIDTSKKVLLSRLPASRVIASQEVRSSAIFQGFDSQYLCNNTKPHEFTAFLLKCDSTVTGHRVTTSVLVCGLRVTPHETDSHNFLLRIEFTFDWILVEST